MSLVVPTLWYRNDGLIGRDQSVRFLDRDPQIRKLILVPAGLNDSGNYSCSVGNATGTAINIIVLGKWATRLHTTNRHVD